jgi:hypothetical protein
LSLFWAISIQSIQSHPISLRSILILFIHLPLDLPSGLFPSGFPAYVLYAFLFFPIRATCPAILKDLGYENVLLDQDCRTDTWVRSSICLMIGGGGTSINQELKSRSVHHESHMKWSGTEL